MNSGSGFGFNFLLLRLDWILRFVALSALGLGFFFRCDSHLQQISNDSVHTRMFVQASFWSYAQPPDDATVWSHETGGILRRVVFGAVVLLHSCRRYRKGQPGPQGGRLFQCPALWR